MDVRFTVKQAKIRIIDHFCGIIISSLTVSSVKVMFSLTGNSSCIAIAT